jgi:hypothetical protein
VPQVVFIDFDRAVPDYAFETQAQFQARCQEERERLIQLFDRE